MPLLLFGMTLESKEGVETDHIIPASIMVVEDDPTFLKFWRRFLADLGVEHCEILDNPLKAKEILKERPYTLLISDIILPSINGFDLAEAARKFNPQIEILLTTAYVRDLSRFRPHEHRFHLLHKPYSNLKELKRLILCLLHGEDAISDASEHSFSDNEDYPEVTEWEL